MRTLATTLTLITLAGAADPALADDWRQDRRWASPAEVSRSYDRVQRERRDLAEAYRYGDRGQVRREQRDVARAEREFYRDQSDLRRARAAYGGRWNGGWDGFDRGGYYADRRDPRRYGYGQPAYGYDNPGWRPEAYYRDGRYQPRPIGWNEPIYRGNDGRYYCRRNDGTTGLILGALGGGVLGNIIAPGGSKTLGSIIGGGLGAVVGNQVGRGNVNCR